MATKKVKEISVPEDMAHLEQDFDKNHAARVKEFAAKRQAKLKEKLAADVQQFEERLKDRNSTARQVILRKMMIERLKADKRALSEAIKEHQDAIRQLRGTRRRKSTKKEEKATASA